MRKITKSVFALAAASAIAAPLAAVQFDPGTAPGTFVGPSSTQTPYVIPTAPGWETVSILSVGDTATENGYSMVGIPDGLGATFGKYEDGVYVADKSYMTVFMNHELGNAAGVPRLHGTKGAFVSQWAIHMNSLQVRRGEDLIRTVYKWNNTTQAFEIDALPNFNRFCSADLPPTSALYNPASGKGYNGGIFMNGEEASTGRGYAHIVTGLEKGTSYELPHLGRFAFENSLARANSGDKTIVVSTDDTSSGGGGEVYVYVGDKRSTGNPVERAGLVGGSLYGIKVTNGGTNYGGGAVASENAGAINGAFTLLRVTDPNYVQNAPALQTFSTANGFTKFARPEDGAWDTLNPNVFYVVVTGAINGGQSARLYKLTFTFDVNGVPTGGAIAMVIDRASLMPAAPANTAMFDNMTVDADGIVMIQEDPGGNNYLALTWKVNPLVSPATATRVLQSDPLRFAPPFTPPFDGDDESSGIIEVTEIVKNANWYEKGRRYFLSDIQAHYPIANEAVEGGQLYLIASPKAEF